MTWTPDPHIPMCPPESRCSVCWKDDDAVIKALVVERDHAFSVRDNWCEAFTRARDALLLERKRLVSLANHIGKKEHDQTEYIDRIEAIDKALAPFQPTLS